MTFFPISFKLCNTVGIVLGLCDGFLLVFSLGLKTNKNQEFLLDGHCVGSLLGVLMGVLVGILLVKPDGDKVGY